jgi:hypothetical protein
VKTTAPRRKKRGGGSYTQAMGMAWWSRFRSLVARGLGLGRGDGTDSEETDNDDAPTAVIYGVIEDWNPRTAIGLISLEDEAELGFGGEACQGFTPLLGIKVQVLSTGLPPSEFTDGPGLWATRLLLRPGTEAEYAARLRIQQVQRAVKLGNELMPATAESKSKPEPAQAQTASGRMEEPPWARARIKAGRKPAGPPRPQDAFFVLTVVLGRELPANDMALARLFNSEYVRKPVVRIIPLIKKGKPEPGFSGEVLLGSRRAFFVYRPEAYGPTDSDGEMAGAGHVGLFVGGPHSPRVAAELGVAANPEPLADDGEVRFLSDLARSLLRWDVEARGVVVNRARKAWKPRDIALSQLGERDAERVPFVLWIDWNQTERAQRPVMQSSGMESLGLPDVAVAIDAQTDDGDNGVDGDRARDVLLYICRELATGALRLPPSVVENPKHQPKSAAPIELAVPRRVRLLPASELLIESGGPERNPDDVETYVLTERDELCAMFCRKPTAAQPKDEAPGTAPDSTPDSTPGSMNDPSPASGSDAPTGPTGSPGSTDFGD